jgi:integrase
MTRQRIPILQRGRSFCLKYRTPEGKQKWESYKTEKEASERRLELLDQFKDCTFAERKETLFEDFASEWIKQRLSVRGSTASAYESVIRKHLIPYFGKMSIRKINLPIVQRFVLALSKKISAKTVRNAAILLRGMMASRRGGSAIQLGLIRYDPCEGVELPHLDHKEMILLTVEQAWKLINAASLFGMQVHGMIYLGAYTGLRRGELLALTFQDVDFLNKELLVTKAISRAPARDGVHRWEWRISHTKSRKSRRRVALNDEVLKTITTLREASADHEGLMFCSSTGKPIDPDVFDEIFDEVRRKAELKDVRFHDLRHFFASMLIAQGESAKYVSDQLGHSSVQVTFDIYGHLFPTARQEAAKRFHDAMLVGSKNLVAEKAKQEGMEGETAETKSELIN